MNRTLPVLVLLSLCPLAQGQQSEVQEGGGAKVSFPAPVVARSIRQAPKDWTFPKEAALPRDFPAPTVPGVIEVKSYPVVRGAWHQLDGALNNGANRAFWPLFQHIQKNGIPMTAPVVAAYPEDVARENAGRMEMSFLYPSTGEGSIGWQGRVEVRDSEQQNFVSVGILGPYDLNTMRRGLDELQQWLRDHPRWQQDGAPRRLMYQNPTWRAGAGLYSEVQLPVVLRPRDVKDSI